MPGITIMTAIMTAQATSTAMIAIAGMPDITVMTAMMTAQATWSCAAPVPGIAEIAAIGDPTATLLWVRQHRHTGHHGHDGDHDRSGDVVVRRAGRATEYNLAGEVLAWQR
jgi:hypothetical protein